MICIFLTKDLLVGAIFILTTLLARMRRSGLDVGLLRLDSGHYTLFQISICLIIVSEIISRLLKINFVDWDGEEKLLGAYFHFTCNPG